ncbi:MAG: NAD-dependent epimerase/dehydratase family protein [Planctomycetaceae bacterium]
MVSSLESSKFVIAGGSGFLGLSLARHLTDRGASVVILSRSVPRIDGPWQHQVWDGRTLGPWKDALNTASGLVNLAGRSVDCIKTPDHQDEIVRSRVESTRILGAAMREIDSPPPVWVQMSTAHIYGDPPEVLCTEESALGYGLAPFVGKAWEEAYADSVLPSQRQVILRTSFVLGRNRGAGAGALDTLLPLTGMGLGGRIGSGTQGMSWIHELDMNRLLERGLSDARMQGVYIASAPNPVSQVEFMRELRRSVGMPIGLPAFSWMVRFGARFLLRTDPELGLYGRYVHSRRLAEESFEFQLPTLHEALQELLRSSKG